ncbi:hypothetical protein PQG02_34460 (plasmid) [Nostoc sp. UHCC 0926]|uniref:hypothetical protein n=1 Tax=Nostoc sp. UHCC 0926 TaxID=3025190 RepID=UPI002362EB71|nr:hypothetical protein [Nostoc sp. UHCC 0926]WDD36938.1 hypothetical protein PQG02_34460 [Nostoc sp. UHCC 0926]
MLIKTLVVGIEPQLDNKISIEMRTTRDKRASVVCGSTQLEEGSTWVGLAT